MAMEPKLAAGESVEPPRSVEPERSRRFALIVVGAISLLFLASVFYTPSAVQSDGSYFTLCGFKAITGLPCPGCGLTHSFCALGQGNVKEAFDFNLLGPPLFLVAAVVWLRFTLVILGWVRPALVIDQMIGQAVLVRSIVIAFGIFGVARIVYLSATGAPAFQQSPLAKLIERLTG